MSTLAETVLPDELNFGTTPGLDALFRTLANGTGAGMAKYIWHNYYAIASGMNTTIDLTSLTDEWGATFSFAWVQWLLVVPTNPKTDNTNILTLGGAGSNPWTGAPWGAGSLTVQDITLLTTQYRFPVSGSSKNLKLAASGSAASNFILALVGQ